MGYPVRYAARRAFRTCLAVLRQIIYAPRRWLTRPPTSLATAKNSAERSKPAHRIRCAEVWGGIRNADVEALTSGVRASLFSSACDGGAGGDVYYFSVCGSDSLTRVALADVTGHGEQVSQVGQWLYDALAARMNSLRGDRVLSELNDLADHYGLSAVSTLAVVQFYRRKSQLYVSYAGHPPALVYRASVGRWEPAEVKDPPGLSNLPIGVSDQTRYRQESQPLASGDRILLYTDGVIEAPGVADSSLFGMTRLLETANARANVSLQELKTAIVDAVRVHTGGSLVHDDVTVLAMEVI